MPTPNAIDTANPHPEAVLDAALPVHVQALEAAYRDRVALKAEAGFAPDIMVTPRDLLDASFRRIDATFAKASPNAKPFAGIYRRGSAA